MRKFIITILFCTSTWTLLSAEYLYLKDGQVIQGTIESEDSNNYKVKTKYQTKLIPRQDVIRIMFGERKMESIFLLMNDGTSKKGFLVEQDAEKIIMREKEDSPKEITILKKDVKQMSGSDIVQLNPSVYFKAGYFFPLNSGGAELNSAPAFFAGSDINFQYIKNTRVLLEAGYISCGSSNDGLTMRFIPLLLSLKYNYYIGQSSFSVIPGITTGMTLIDYNDGENSEYRGFAGTFGCGLGFGYEVIKNSLYMALSSDYILFRDREGMLHSAAGSLAVSYRF